MRKAIDPSALVARSEREARVAYDDVDGCRSVWRSRASERASELEDLLGRRCFAGLRFFARVAGCAGRYVARIGSFVFFFSGLERRFFFGCAQKGREAWSVG